MLTLPAFAGSGVRSHPREEAGVFQASRFAARWHPPGLRSSAVEDTTDVSVAGSRSPCLNCVPKPVLIFAALPRCCQMPED